MSSVMARNTLYLTLASIAQKVIAFVYFTLVANTIGKEATGAYFLALSITIIFSAVSDWGLTPVLIREVAKKPEEALRWVRSVLGLKIPFMFLGAVGSLFTAWLLNVDAEVFRLVLIAVFVLAADALSLTWFGVLRGMQNLRYESLGIFVGQLLTSVFGAIALMLAPTLEILVTALLVGSVWNACYSATRVAKHLGGRALVPTLETGRAKQLLRWSLAFAISAVFVKVYSYIDILLLGELMGKGAVGIYSIAYKITYAFQFLPLAFMGALYPAMSALVGKDTSRLRHLYDDAVWYLALLSTPIVFGLASIADQLVPAFYSPEFSEAILPLQLLVFVLLLAFFDFPTGSLLSAANRQGTKTVIMGFTMAINIVANLLLIPAMGVPGASVASLISFAFLFLAGMTVVPQIIPYTILDLGRRVAPILFSGLVMAAVVWVLSGLLHFVLLIAVGAVVYVSMLFLTKAVSQKHLVEVAALMRRRPSEEAIAVPIE